MRISVQRSAALAIRLLDTLNETPDDTDVMCEDRATRERNLKDRVTSLTDSFDLAFPLFFTP